VGKRKCKESRSLSLNVFQHRILICVYDFNYREIKQVLLSNCLYTVYDASEKNNTVCYFYFFSFNIMDMCRIRFYSKHEKKVQSSRVNKSLVTTKVSDWTIFSCFGMGTPFLLHGITPVLTCSSLQAVIYLYTHIW
jgi:hypothetical protein